MTPQTQRSLRRYHHYLGLFFAPAIFFFALSGALQTFRLQEVKGWGGTPPGWIVWLASIHKDSGPPREKRSGSPRVTQAAEHDGHEHADDTDEHRMIPATPPALAASAQPRVARPSPLPMKIFAVLMSIGLMFSTALGVAIALNNRSMRRISLILLVAGTALPCALIWI